MADLHGRDFLSISDLSSDELTHILELTKTLKAERGQMRWRTALSGKTLAMLFMKPSTRTRVSFDVAMYELGGHSITLSPSETQLSRGETVSDTGQVLSRFVSCIMARVTSHDILVDLAQHSSVPVINGLSDLEHPCQAVTDMFTIWERKGTLKGLRIAFVGDANNVADSLMLASLALGADFSIATPKGYEPRPEILREGTGMAEKTGSSLITTDDPIEAVKDADAIYTDVWVSMGHEDEAKERARVFYPKYQVNIDLLRTASAEAIVLHCQPWHIGLEITEDVAYGPRCVAFDQAENRMHAQKAILLSLIG